MATRLFLDRVDAGRRLAEHLVEYAGRRDVIVLALPRGGVPVGYEVATRLAVALDVFVVRKLGVPGHAELAMGAIAAGGVEVLHEDLIRQLEIPGALVRQVAGRERQELERREAQYRKGRQPPEVSHRIAILVDDGLATGATMEAAITAVRALELAGIVVAVPVGAEETCERLRPFVDRLVCLQEPKHFAAVGLWYEDFSPTSDEEVQRLLTAAGCGVEP